MRADRLVHCCIALPADHRAVGLSMFEPLKHSHHNKTMDLHCTVNVLLYLCCGALSLQTHRQTVSITRLHSAGFTCYAVLTCRCQIRSKRKGKFTMTGTSNASSSGLQRTGSEISDSTCLSSFCIPCLSGQAFPYCILLHTYNTTAYHCVCVAKRWSYHV